MTKLLWERNCLALLSHSITSLSNAASYSKNLPKSFRLTTLWHHTLHSIVTCKNSVIPHKQKCFVRNSCQALMQRKLHLCSARKRRHETQKICYLYHYLDYFHRAERLAIAELAFAWKRFISRHLHGLTPLRISLFAPKHETFVRRASICLQGRTDHFTFSFSHVSMCKIVLSQNMCV